MSRFRKKTPSGAVSLQYPTKSCRNQRSFRSGGRHNFGRKQRPVFSLMNRGEGDILVEGIKLKSLINAAHQAGLAFDQQSPRDTAHIEPKGLKLLLDYIFKIAKESNQPLFVALNAVDLVSCPRIRKMLGSDRDAGTRESIALAALTISTKLLGNNRQQSHMRRLARWKMKEIELQELQILKTLKFEPDFRFSTFWTFVELFLSVWPQLLQEFDRDVDMTQLPAAVEELSVVIRLEANLRMVARDTLAAAIMLAARLVICHASDAVIIQALRQFAAICPSKPSRLEIIQLVNELLLFMIGEERCYFSNVFLSIQFAAQTPQAAISLECSQTGLTQYSAISNVRTPTKAPPHRWQSGSQVPEMSSYTKIQSPKNRVRKDPYARKDASPFRKRQT
eukprot:g38846.t1